MPKVDENNFTFQVRCILNIAFVILKIKIITSVLSEELTDEISGLKRPVNINCLMRKDFASGLNSKIVIKIRNTIVDKFFLIILD
jgi:hypothetical protein